MKKRIMCLLLAAVMLICAVPAISPVFYANDANAPEKNPEEAPEYAMPDILDANDDYQTDVVDADLEKYIDLYYDDGHLISMLKLSDIKDSEVAHNGNGENIDGKRVVIGNRHETGGEYDSYVRILAGKYAGDYYRLVSKGEEGIAIDDEGFIKYNEPFLHRGSVECGIVFSSTYAEADLNTPSPTPSSTSSFIQNTEYLQYDDTYGNFTMEGVYRLACDYYFVGNESKGTHSLLMGVKDQGFFDVNVEPPHEVINRLWTGEYTNDGTDMPALFPVNETYHFMGRIAFTSPTTMYRTLYLNAPDKGLTTTYSNIELGFDLNKVDDDRSGFIALNQGTKMYLLRFYDVSLTPEQMKQNHFADLCYYYGLEIDGLLRLGSIVLTEEFYDGFLRYNVGMCTELQIDSMQNTINRLVSAELDTGKLIENIANNYQTALTNAESYAESLEAVEAIYNGIDAYIQQVQGMVAVNEESEELFAQCLQDMEGIKDNINLYYNIVQKHDANVQAVKEIATTVYNATSVQTDTDTLLTNNNTLDSKMHYSTEGVLHIARFMAHIEEGDKDIARMVKRAKSINAQTSFNVADYVRFAGYQVRITDYAAMRALFAIDSDAIAAGYTYKEQSYSIASHGFVMAYADNESIDITYDGNYAYTDANGAIIRYADKWTRNSELDSAVAECTQMNGADAYTFVKAYNGADVPNIASEYQKEYKLRAFLVLEGEGVQFVRYLDVESVNVGGTVSMYELAKHASTVESAENLNDEYYISRVIAAVEGKED